LKGLDDIKSGFKFFLNAILLLTILGWVQLAIFYGFHHDIFPLAISDSGIVRSGVWNTQGFNFFRMSSLGGEPKSLSILLVIGYFFLRVFNKNNLFFYGKSDKFIKPVFLITAIATASTSGLVLLIILYLSNSFFDIFHSKIQLSLKFKLTKFLITLTIIGVFISLTSIYWDYITFFLKARLIERNIASEDFDYPIQEFLKNHLGFLPFGTGMGNAHNFAYPYILPETKKYMSNSIFVAKSGYLKLLSETGLTGLILFVCIPVSIYVKLRYLLRNQTFSVLHKSIIKSSLSILFLISIGYLTRTYLINEIVLVYAFTGYISTHTDKPDTLVR
jgi:hypothetical protein